MCRMVAIVSSLFGRAWETSDRIKHSLGFSFFVRETRRGAVLDCNKICRSLDVWRAKIGTGLDSGLSSSALFRIVIKQSLISKFETPVSKSNP
jgi:hypothetical protein